MNGDRVMYTIIIPAMIIFGLYFWDQSNWPGRTKLARLWIALGYELTALTIVFARSIGLKLFHDGSATSFGWLLGIYGFFLVFRYDIGDAVPSPRYLLRLRATKKKNRELRSRIADLTSANGSTDSA